MFAFSMTVLYKNGLSSLYSAKRGAYLYSLKTSCLGSIMEKSASADSR